MNGTSDLVSSEIVLDLERFIESAVVAACGDTTPIRPVHRIPFHWPPHPVSSDYHVLASDWSGRSTLHLHGEELEVLVARTAQGIFGRVEGLWNEARGTTEAEMLRRLAKGCEPYFARKLAITHLLGLTSVFTGNIRQLDPSSLVKLLYCPDRDIANSARIEIEKQASSGIYTPALIMILNDDRHPHRRIAQWCVLDMFEDLPSFCKTECDMTAAVLAIRNLLWSAEDDHARTIYKAGVVLGGHVSNAAAGDALMDCLFAPSRTGRRSAIHAVFHLIEWLPNRREVAIEGLNRVAAEDPEPILRRFAASMAHDLSLNSSEHVTEPLFVGEE